MPQIHPDIMELSDQAVMTLNGEIVSLAMVPTIWKQITGRDYDRTTAIRAHTSGKIKPMGQNRGRLYFWTREIKQAAPSTDEKRGRPRKSKNDEFSGSS